MMLKIAICDDEIACVDLLYNALAKFLVGEGIEYTIQTFFSGEELLRKDTTKFDIIFLDIRMNEINGIEVARRIRQTNQQVMLLFVTSVVESAVFGYEVNAFRYLLKDRIEEQINTYMKSVLEELKVNGEVYEIECGTETIALLLNDVYYFKSELRKINAVTSKKDYQFYGKLNDMEKELSSKGFVRCHQSFLVNTYQIKQVDKRELLLKNHFTIPVSQSRYREVEKQYMWSLR